MPGIDYRELRNLVSMQEVLTLLAWTGVGSGNQLRGPCPVHESNAPRSRVFSVNLAKKTFQCFKCKAAGNHLDLWAATTRLPLFKAAVDLCERLQRPVPWLRSKSATRNT